MKYYINLDRWCQCRDGLQQMLWGVHGSIHNWQRRGERWNRGGAWVKCVSADILGFKWFWKCSRVEKWNLALSRQSTDKSWSQHLLRVKYLTFCSSGEQGGVKVSGLLWSKVPGYGVTDGGALPWPALNGRPSIAIEITPSLICSKDTLAQQCNTIPPCCSQKPVPAHLPPVRQPLGWQYIWAGQ